MKIRGFTAPVLPALLLALLLGGCGGKTPVYTHPELGKVQAEQDYHGCVFEAQKATGNLADDSSRKERVAEMIESCMRSKGYTPE